MRRLTRIESRAQIRQKLIAAARAEIADKGVAAASGSSRPQILEPFASFAVEVQTYANHKLGDMKSYDRDRADFHAALGRLLPSRPATNPAHLAMSLLATGVGFSTIGSDVSLEERRRIVAIFFRGAIGYKVHPERRFSATG